MNGTLELIDLYYKVRTFNPNKQIKNRNLRDDMMNQVIKDSFDALFEKPIRFIDVYENPQNYGRYALRKALEIIQEYIRLDNLVKEKKDEK